MSKNDTINCDIIKNTNWRNVKMQEEFCDVTLACDDKQVQAHKLVLASYSSVFRDLLIQNPHPHPVIYLNGIKCDELANILNFMYLGHVNLNNEHLGEFMKVMNNFGIDGSDENTDTEDDFTKSGEGMPVDENDDKVVNNFEKDSFGDSEILLDGAEENTTVDNDEENTTVDDDVENITVDGDADDIILVETNDSKDDKSLLLPSGSYLEETDDKCLPIGSPIKYIEPSETNSLLRGQTTKYLDFLLSNPDFEKFYPSEKESHVNRIVWKSISDEVYSLNKKASKNMLIKEVHNELNQLGNNDTPIESNDDVFVSDNASFQHLKQVKTSGNIKNANLRTKGDIKIQPKPTKSNSKGGEELLQSQIEKYIKYLSGDKNAEFMNTGNAKQNNVNSDSVIILSDSEQTSESKIISKIKNDNNIKVDIQCQVCQQTCASITKLKSHILLKHPQVDLCLFCIELYGKSDDYGTHKNAYTNHYRLKHKGVIEQRKKKREELNQINKNAADQCKKYGGVSGLYATNTKHETINEEDMVRENSEINKHRGITVTDQEVSSFSKTKVVDEDDFEDGDKDSLEQREKDSEIANLYGTQNYM